MDDLDIRDVMLEATAEVQEIIREVIADLTAPQVREKLLESWATAPEELKEMFATERPEEYAALMDLMKRS